MNWHERGSTAALNEERGHAHESRHGPSLLFPFRYFRTETSSQASLMNIPSMESSTMILSSRNSQPKPK